MSAQIIMLSDHRKIRPAPMPGLMGLSLSIVVANLVIWVAIYEVFIQAAQQGFNRC
jgi:hypothetical protein